MDHPEQATVPDSEILSRRINCQYSVVVLALDFQDHTLLSFQYIPPVV